MVVVLHREPRGKVGSVVYAVHHRNPIPGHAEIAGTREIVMGTGVDLSGDPAVETAHLVILIGGFGVGVGGARVRDHLGPGQTLRILVVVVGPAGDLGQVDIGGRVPVHLLIEIAGEERGVHAVAVAGGTREGEPIVGVFPGTADRRGGLVEVVRSKICGHTPVERPRLAVVGGDIDHASRPTPPIEGAGGPAQDLHPADVGPVHVVQIRRHATGVIQGKAVQQHLDPANAGLGQNPLPAD